MARFRGLNRLRETRIFCNLPSQQIKIQGYQMSDPDLKKFFQVELVGLSAEQVRKQKGATSGVLVRVKVKPGLPLGRFQQRILLSTNLNKYPEVDIPLFGSVGEITLVGLGWNSETGTLDIGAADSHGMIQRRLVVLARGPEAKEIKFKVASVEPGFMKVNLGKTTAMDGGALSQTELLIEIPPSEVSKIQSPPHPTVAENGRLGEILLETTYPSVRSLRIRVRIAAAGGSQSKL